MADEGKLFELAKPAICGPLADGTTIAGEETTSNLGGGDDAVSPDPGEDGDIAVGDTGAGTAKRGSRGPRRQPSLCRSQKGRPDTGKFHDATRMHLITTRSLRSARYRIGGRSGSSRVGKNGLVAPCGRRRAVDDDHEAQRRPQGWWSSTKGDVAGKG
jgi:hypothetical protein